MAADNIIKYLGLTVDGRGYAGNLQEYNPPDLTLATEEFRAGGMDAPIDIDMGLEKLTTSYVLTNYSPDVLALWGVKQGGFVQCTARGSMESLDGTKTPIIHHMQGTIVSIVRGTWGSGALPSITVTQTLRYYREIVGGKDIHELDVINMVRTVNGVDQLVEHRRNIGI